MSTESDESLSINPSATALKEDTANAAATETAPERFNDSTPVSNASKLGVGTSQDGNHAASEGSLGPNEGSDRGRRRRHRDRHRSRVHTDHSTVSDFGEAEQDTAPQWSPHAAQEQVGELLAQVLSGAFDQEEPAGETVPAVETAPKRVLAPEADAPKLQRVLGQAGVGSRRDMEELILDGRITVNGGPAHIGQRITWGDRIQVDGKPIKYRISPPPPRILAYHKPVGELVTHDDPQQRPTVFRRLPRLQQGKWQSVGRLDINTEGLLLVTNSGELANQLMHPRFGVEREYAVRVLGTLDQAAMETLLAGVPIEAQTANFKSIEDGGGEGANHWYRVVITEGRNREVRKMFDAVGLTVSRLIRVRYGTVVLPRGLKRGAWVDLDDADVRLIRQLANPRAVNGNASNRGPRGGGPRPSERGERKRESDRPHADPASAPGTANDEGLDFDPARIPNPLEQTFDKRFAQNPRSSGGLRGLAHGGGGFGAGGSAPNPPLKRGNGPHEPDPLQTSLGYIGADAVFRKGGRRGSQGGSGGGNRNNAGGNRGGGRGGQRSR